MLSDNNLTQRFLSAVEDIRAELDAQYGWESRGFGDAWNRALQHGVPVAKRNREIGQVLRELRNVISHGNYRSGEPVATPREDIVETAEALLSQVRNEPQIQNFMTHSVQTVRPNTPFKQVAKIISEQGFSQIPVVDGDADEVGDKARIVGLLTMRAIGRWVANLVVDKNRYSLASTTTEAILEHVGQSDVPIFVKPSDPAIEVCNSLTDNAQCPAALITRTGDADGVLMGIVARADLGRIYREISLD